MFHPAKVFWHRVAGLKKTRQALSSKGQGGENASQESPVDRVAGQVEALSSTESGKGQESGSRTGLKAPLVLNCAGNRGFSNNVLPRDLVAVRARQGSHKRRGAAIVHLYAPFLPPLKVGQPFSDTKGALPGRSSTDERGGGGCTVPAGRAKARVEATTKRRFLRWIEPRRWHPRRRSAYG